MIEILALPGFLSVVALFWYAFNYDLDKPFSMKAVHRLFKTKHKYSINNLPKQTGQYIDPASRKNIKCKPYPSTGHTDSFVQEYGGYINYLHSDAWKAKRDHVLARDNHTCQRCKSTVNLQIHHNSYRNIYHEEDNNYEDLVTLCGSCHTAEHNKEN